LETADDSFWVCDLDTKLPKILSSLSRNIVACAKDEHVFCGCCEFSSCQLSVIRNHRNFNATSWRIMQHTISWIAPDAAIFNSAIIR
jgi:hypothetical protein